MTTVKNPILPGMYPDPSCIFDAERNQLVLANSSFELVPGLPISVSNDGADWSTVTHAVDVQMARKLMIPAVDDSGGLYAPTLRKIKGRYVIACTVARLNAARARQLGYTESDINEAQEADGNFVIVASDVHGPWSGPYWVKGAAGIDPDVFEDTDGTVFWTQTVPASQPEWNGQTTVWTQQISAETWQLEGERYPLWNGYGRDAVWAEGPHCYRIGSFVYLMTAEGGTSINHSEMIMRAKATNGFKSALENASVLPLSSNGLLDLFRPNPKNPILTHRHLGAHYPLQDVGHADLVEHPHLGWLLVCLGIRRQKSSDGAELNYLGRETYLAVVEWEKDEENPESMADNDDVGWPVVSPGIGRLTEQVSLPAVAVQPQRTQDHMAGGALDVVCVRGDEALGKFIRVPRVPFTVAMGSEEFREGHELVLYRDGSNEVSVRPTGSTGVTSTGVASTGVTVWVRSDGQVSDSNLALVDGAHVGMVFAGDCLSVVAIDPTDSAGYERVLPGFYVVSRESAASMTTLATVPTDFMSTERAGGFVGCLVGVREIARS